MKVELEPDEAWELMSIVVARLAGEAALADGDRAKLRRWRSESMQPSGEGMRLLTEKVNADIAATLSRKRASHIRKPDWRK